MTSWKELDRFRKILVAILVAATVLGCATFALIGRQEGIVHDGDFLAKQIDQSGDRWNTVYSGKVLGELVSFTVTPEKEVIYQKGESEAVTYTVVKDPAAAPDGWSVSQGVEVRQGEKIIFRGAYMGTGNGLWLVNEAGYSNEHPSQEVETVVDIICGDPLIKRGDGLMLLYALLFTAGGLILIFFAEALFHLDLAFRIRDPYYAEPSEWELISRAMGQIVFTAGAVICYILCLMHW